ncbi:hypothetical protein [Pseudophaeobacter leonis]|uniref:hypothetical protein n=1 Tax=Pseudophaeobacter leonis TaxID=1144477 RepID=UPI0009F46EF5|nr:hypothetical protein [Pseudophaeobacter leonis]
MLDKRTVLIGAATAACALGIGFLMQPAAVGDSATGLAQISAQQRMPSDPALASQLEIEKITLTSRQELPPVGGGESDVAAQNQTQDQASATTSAGTACRMQASAKALPGAMVALTILARCRAGERVTLHHQGMMVTETLEDSGSLSLTVPALASSAIFIIEPTMVPKALRLRTAPAGGAVVQVAVPDMAQVDRVVLQWSGNSGFEVHAREFGAQYGERGHVWHGADPARGAGEMIQLGDRAQLSPRLAEVYSFRRDTAAADGVIEISVEAEVTEINCGREIAAQSLRFSQGRVQTRDLVLEMPDCTATGDFLVLNNLVEHLKITAK